MTETVNGHTTGYEYDPAGQRIRRVTPSGAVSEWSYDAAGHAIGLSTAAGHLDFGMDAAGRLAAATMSGARIDLVRDSAGRPTSLSLNTDGAGGAPLLTRSWAYRPDGSLTEQADTLRGSRRYQSDALGRVTSAAASTWSESYAYDAFGNLADAESSTTSDTDGSRQTYRTLIRQAGRTTYEHDEAGRLIRTTRRTLDGRRKVWHYTWDADDHLTQTVTPDDTTWRYTYDPLGRRILKAREDNGAIAESISFVWDGMRLAEQLTIRPDGKAETLTWEYEPDTFRPVAQTCRLQADASQQEADEAFYAIVTDLVGTPTELIGSRGDIAWHTTTSVWGRTLTATGGADCPLRFPGQYFDPETGLHYNLHRYYDPDTASYLSPDPLGLTAAPNDHAYVSDPFTWIDPFGLYGAGGGTMCGAAKPGRPRQEAPGQRRLERYHFGGPRPKPHPRRERRLRRTGLGGQQQEVHANPLEEEKPPASRRNLQGRRRPRRGDDHQPPVQQGHRHPGVGHRRRRHIDGDMLGQLLA